MKHQGIAYPAPEVVWPLPSTHEGAGRAGWLRRAGTRLWRAYFTGWLWYARSGYTPPGDRRSGGEWTWKREGR